MKRLVIGPASLRFQIRFQSTGLRGKQESPGTPAMARKEKYISLLMESRRRSLRPARPVQNRRHGLLPVKLMKYGEPRSDVIDSTSPASAEVGFSGRFLLSEALVGSTTLRVRVADELGNFQDLQTVIRSHRK